MSHTDLSPNEDGVGDDVHGDLDVDHGLVADNLRHRTHKGQEPQVRVRPNRIDLIVHLFGNDNCISEGHVWNLPTNPKDKRSGISAKLEMELTRATCVTKRRLKRKLTCSKVMFLVSTRYGVRNDSAGLNWVKNPSTQNAATINTNCNTPKQVPQWDLCIWSLTLTWGRHRKSVASSIESKFNFLSELRATLLLSLFHGNSTFFQLATG